MSLFPAARSRTLSNACPHRSRLVTQRGSRAGRRGTVCQLAADRRTPASGADSTFNLGHRSCLRRAGGARD
eukprot:14429898-Alexandrium_andersonii.AAC.1